MYQLASSGSNLRSGRQSFADGTFPCSTTPPSAGLRRTCRRLSRTVVDAMVSYRRIVPFAGVDPANEVGGIAIPVDMRNLPNTRFRRERR
jgi:hypothetical protein